MTIERYWTVPIFAGNYPSESELLDETEAMLRKCGARRQCAATFRLAGISSAGVDSSLLVALMTESSDKVNTYSIGFNYSVA